MRGSLVHSAQRASTWAAACLYCFLLWQRPSGAAGQAAMDCTEPAAEPITVVTLAFGPDALSAEVQHQTLATLRSTLPAQVRLCPADSPAADSTSTRLSLHSRGSHRLQVVLDDPLTNRQVRRPLDLGSFPDDSRPLAIAVACDELLRASWLEKSIAERARTQPTQPPSPAEAEPAVRASPPLRAPRASEKNAIFAQGVLARYGGGMTLFGVDLGFSRTLTPRWTGTVALGGRRSRWYAGELGRARLSAAALELGIGYAVIRKRMLRVLLQGTTTTMLAHVQAQANGPANEAHSALQPMVHVHAGISARLKLLRPITLRGDLLAGLPIRSLSLEDPRGQLTATTGLALQCSLGVEVNL